MPPASFVRRVYCAWRRRCGRGRSSTAPTISRALAGESQLPHVGDVEDARARPHRTVLVADAGVLDGHLHPQGDETRAESGVALEQGVRRAFAPANPYPEGDRSPRSGRGRPAPPPPARCCPGKARAARGTSGVRGGAHGLVTAVPARNEMLRTAEERGDFDKRPDDTSKPSAGASRSLGSSRRSRRYALSKPVR